MREGYVEEEKLYRVYRKKENHMNTKMNPDGTMAGLQFTDESNGLDGPVLIKPVDEGELERSIYVDEGTEARSFRQIILEEVVAPNLEYAIERALEIGFDYFSAWMEEVAIPKAKTKAKNFMKDAKIIMSGVKDGLAGKEPKAVRLIRECEETKNTAVDVVKTEAEKESVDKELRSPEEVQKIIEAMRTSAVIIAAGVRMLSNTVIADDGSDPERRLEMQRNLNELTSESVMNQINLLLEDKNRDLLDQASLRMLTAFRDGKFIVNGESVPISNYLSLEQ